MRQVSEMNAEHITQAARREYVIDIAAATAVGLREAASKSNIRQPADFINGLILTGLLIEKNLPNETDDAIRFVEIFRAEEETFRRLIERGSFANAERTKRNMATHQIGIADQSPSEMLVHLGMAGQGVLQDLAAEKDLTKRECLEIVSFAIVLALVANTDPDVLDIVMDGVRQSVEEKVSFWDGAIPSDEEMFEGWDEDTEGTEDNDGKA